MVVPCAALPGWLPESLALIRGILTHSAGPGKCVGPIPHPPLPLPWAWAALGPVECPGHPHATWQGRGVAGPGGAFDAPLRSTVGVRIKANLI